MATYMSARNLVCFCLASKICSLHSSLAAHRTLPVLVASNSQQARSLCRLNEWRIPQKEERNPLKSEALECEEDPYKQETEKCILCKYQVPVSYKNVQLLSQFVSPNTGRIFGRHITKLCEAQQKRVTKAIKRAVKMGFMPDQYRETQFLKDPNLYDVKYTGSTVVGQYSKLPDSNISQEELLERQQHAAEEEKKTTQS